MSIEQTLERIATGIEKLIELQDALLQATAFPQANSPNIPNVPAPMPGPSGTGPGQTMPAPVPPPAAPAPVGGPPVGGPPVGGPPPLAAVPTPAPGPQPVPAPGAPPASAPAVDTGLLDQIRDAANTFHRAHPEQVGEIWAILSSAGVQKIDAIPPQNQQQVLQQIQALGA